MTEIFSDGFESNNFDAWTGTSGSPSIVEDPVRQGSYAAQADAAYDYWHKTISEQTTFYLRFYFQYSDILYFNAVEVYAGATKIGTWQPMADGKMRYIYKNGGSDEYLPAYAGYAANLQTGEWYCLEIKHTIDGSNGEVEMWLDEVSCGSVSGKDTNNYGNIDSFRMGRGYGAGTCAITYDSVVAADTYIGPEVVEEGVLGNRGNLLSIMEVMGMI